MHDADAEVKRWLAAAALLLPVAALYLAHYLLLPEPLFAHGFLQYDQPYYLANAREHFDQGFSLLYRLPFTPSYDSPALYVQPLSLLYGVLLQLTGIDPGALYVASGFVFGLVCLRLAIALYEMLFGLDGAAPRLGLVLFAWGGGLFVLAGAAYMLWKGASDPALLLTFDPGGGWWFLNFGRNLVYPTEAFYHLLTLAILILLIRKRWAGAALLCLLLSASHPFTGLQIVLMALAWAAFERFFLLRAEGPPAWLAAALATILILHLGYYLGVLGRSAEHGALVEEWRRVLPGTLNAVTLFCAYALVAAPAAWRLRDRVAAGGALAEPHNRLFAIYFLVSFALANHEFLMPPHQPVHFTRGHVWTPLFLLGAPALIALLSWLCDRFGSWLRWTALGAVCGLFLLDNLAFVALGAAEMRHGPGNAPTITHEERALLRQLAEPRFAGHLLVSADPDIAYLATVYTSLRSWTSHINNAPGYRARAAEVEAWLDDGGLQPEWRLRDVVYLVPRDAAPFRDLPWFQDDMEVIETPTDFVLIVDRNPAP